MLAFSGATLVTPNGTVEDGALVVEGGTIVALGRRDEVALPAGARPIDGRGLVVAPGLIDLQLNGGFGHDFTAEPGAMWEVGGRLVEHGVTAFLPTVISSPLQRIARARVALAAAPAGYRGAVPLGLHLEGPFLHPQAAGAHDQTHLHLPDRVVARDWTPANGVRLVTLAPELDGALALVEQLAGGGAVVAAGHSTASYQQGVAAIDAGVRYATHLLNAMPPLDRREPGLAGALLDDARVAVGVIPDGVHLHAAVLRLVARIADVERLSVVTDATAGLGMADGEHVLGDSAIAVAAGVVRRGDGRLAGSALSADEALRRLATLTGRGVAAALAALTSVPARVLGDATRGALVAGARADLVLLSPDLRVVATFVGGEQAYRA